MFLLRWEAFRGFLGRWLLALLVFGQVINDAIELRSAIERLSIVHGGRVFDADMLLDHFGNKALGFKSAGFLVGFSLRI